MKRVSGNYYIPHLAGGLIDSASKGRIDEDYKKKCSELTNFWIKNNNNIAKRPPVRPVAGLEGVKHIIDVTETEDRLVFLRSVDLNIDTTDLSDEEARDARRKLLEEIGWRPGVATEVGETHDQHTDYISPDDPVNFQLWHYGTGPQSLGRDDIPSSSVNNSERTLFPTVTVLDSYDRTTHEHKLDERFYFVRWNFTDSTRNKDWSFGVGNDKNFTSTTNRAYGSLDNLNKTGLTQPAGTGQAFQTWNTQADIIREYTNSLGAAPIHTFVINKAKVIETSTVHGEVHHPVFTQFINEIDVSLLSADALNQLRLYHPGDGEFTNEPRIQARENLFQNTDLPIRLFTNHFGKIEFYAFGLDYIWDKQDLRSLVSSSEELNESTMNTFAEKPTSISLRDLDIRAGIYPTTVDISESDTDDLGDTRFVNNKKGANMTLEELIDEIPDMNRVYEHIQFSLCNIANLPTTHNVYGRLSYIVPDIAIPIPGTDISAYGRFLFNAEYNGENYNVFCSSFDYNKWYNTESNPTPFWRIPATNEETAFPNGYGIARNDYGIYLAFQKRNRNNSNNSDQRDPGKPTYEPILSKFSDDAQADTDFIVFLALDPLSDRVREVMDNLKLISFYSSNEKLGFNAIGMTQLSSYVRDRGEDGPLDPARNTPVGNYVKYKETGLHLIPWAHANLFNVFWEYASSSSPLASISDAGLISDRERLNQNGSFGEGTASWFMDFNNTELNTPARRKFILDESNNERPNGILTTATSTDDFVIAHQRLLAKFDQGSSDYRQLYEIVQFVRTGSAGSYGVGYRRFQARTGGRFEETELTLPIVTQEEIDATAAYRTSGDIRTYADFLIKNGLTQDDLVFPSDTELFNREVMQSTLTFVEYYLRTEHTFEQEPVGASRPLPLLVTRDNFNATRELVIDRLNFYVESGERGSNLYPESTIFVNYYPNTTAQPFEANNRVARAVGNVLAFSNAQNILTEFRPAKFSLGYLRFTGAAPIGRNIAVGAKPSYLSNARLGPGVDIRKRTFQAGDPQPIPLFNKDLTPVSIHDFVETARGGLIVTDKRIYNATRFNTEAIQVVPVHETGFSGAAISDDSYIIGPEGNKLKAIKYYEEAGGYITDIVNAELDFPGDILQGVSFLNKHKLIIFRVEGQPKTLYTASATNQRSLKGFSKFEVPCNIQYLTKLSEDRLGIVTEECEYLEMNFNVDYTNEEGKWQDSHTVDEQGNPIYQPYECAVTTLPILRVYTDDFSLLKTVNLRYLIIGCTGHPAFKIQVQDGNTRIKTAETTFRRIIPGEIEVDNNFSGQVAVKNMPHNGGTQPELRLSKFDDEYIEFSSVNIQLGG